MPRIELGVAGWEARMLPLCYGAPTIRQIFNLFQGLATKPGNSLAGAQQSQLHQDQQQQQQQSIETLARSGNESDSLQNIDKIETVGDSEPRPKRDYRHRQRHRHSSSEFGSMPFESGLRGFKFHEEFLNFRQNFFDGRQLFFGSNSDNNASKRKRWRHESNFCIFTANIKISRC